MKLLSILLIPIGILLLILLLPYFLIRDWLQTGKVKQFLMQHNHTYFFIYSSGKKKAAYCEKQIIPTLPPGVEIVKYDGEKFDSFFTPETYFSLINPSEKGYPIIGKIEEGKIYTESLKDDFSHLVLREKEVKRFVEVLHQKIDAL